MAAGQSMGVGAVAAGPLLSGPWGVGAMAAGPSLLDPRGVGTMAAGPLMGTVADVACCSSPCFAVAGFIREEEPPRLRQGPLPEAFESLVFKYQPSCSTLLWGSSVVVVWLDTSVDVHKSAYLLVLVLEL